MGSNRRLAIRITLLEPQGCAEAMGDPCRVADDRQDYRWNPPSSGRISRDRTYFWITLVLTNQLVRF
jgi:hypothetical protein